jgi:hypothetical protein
MFFKHGQKLNIYNPINHLIISTCGSNDAALIDTPLKSFQQTRDQITLIGVHQGDAASLERLIDETAVYVSVWNCISKNVSFGSGKV